LTDLRQTLDRDLSSSYTIERELRGGGMSRVFVAQDLALNRTIVLKILSPEIAAEVSNERFRREIQLAAKLQHPYIVPLLSAGEISGTPFFTMPYIEGESLGTRLAREGELPIDEAVHILKEVAAALSYAHKHGVVHRDIKPHNVMLTDDFAVVTDFGVAKALTASTGVDQPGNVTTRGVAIGTPSYMAPEQAAGDPGVDHRADIYAFGVMAYEMLTGSPPFSRASAQAMLAAHATETPEPIDRRRHSIPPALAGLVRRCLEKRPADRPQTASEIVHALDAIPTSRGLAASKRALLIGATALAVLLVIGALLYRGATGGSFGRGVRLRNTAVSSIAVLPLVNVGGDSRDEYFSDGMTDELSNALSKLPGLRVASRTSTFAFKSKRDLSLEDIGKSLNVQAVLEGTVRRSGERLRVTAQLTNVADGLALWSDRYERKTQDIFDVQDDIAGSIAKALRLKLAGQAATVSSGEHGTDNLKAYDLYLRGRYFWNARGAENLRRAVTYFNDAIAADPNFGRAHAALAIAYGLLPEYTDSAPPRALELARNAAQRALSIDSTLAEAHTALGIAARDNWEWTKAESAYSKAIAFEPRYPTAHQWFGELLYDMGQMDSSLSQIRTANELDPLAPITFAALGYALTLARRYDDAIAELKKGIELAPSLGIHRALIAFAYVQRGDAQNAVQEMETAVRLDPELVLRRSQLAYVYARTGNRDKAQAIVSALERGDEGRHISPAALAIAYAGLDERDKALKALERAVDIHDLSLLTGATPLLDPTFDPLRSDPRFARILARMNLAQYRSQ
jgi:eukaryotic-like serine/threonine-protein kinase